jgi:hypothetical protein
METTRVAVLGLYNSGSTVVAGILHHLGVYMGPPFWQDCYESYEVAYHLRNWWNEPSLIESCPAERRRCYLARWASLQECLSDGIIGLKHPLLSLCGPDLVQAWGQETRFIWAYRDLYKSIERLLVRQWWPAQESEQLQLKTWKELLRFFDKQPHLRVEHEEILDPAHCERVVRTVASFIGLAPTEERLQWACSFVKTKHYERQSKV